MGGTVHAQRTQLLRSLRSHGAVSLHDPGGNFFIARPGSILDHNAMLCLGSFGGSQADAVIVVQLFDGDFSTLGSNIVKALLGAALGHMNNGLLPQLVGSPGNAPAMVAVGGGKEGGLSKISAERLPGEILIGQLRNVLSHFLGDVPGHGKGAAQDLEGIQPEAVTLVLHVHAAKAKALRHAIQLGQGRYSVLGKAFMEGSSGLYVLQSHDGKLRIVTLGHDIFCPFNGLEHHNTSFLYG